mmetsp:Transcript_36068/g.102611  ORF Transcript_36068/g.102611 Transcript_36068/m.102611 type:complete len:279 (+) Transcript_36068:667-1503(+)
MHHKTGALDERLAQLLHLTLEFVDVAPSEAQDQGAANSSLGAASHSHLVLARAHGEQKQRVQACFCESAGLCSLGEGSSNTEELLHNTGDRRPSACTFQQHISQCNIVPLQVTCGLNIPQPIPQLLQHLVACNFGARTASGVPGAWHGRDALLEICRDKSTCCWVLSYGSASNFGIRLQLLGGKPQDLAPLPHGRVHEGALRAEGRGGEDEGLRILPESGQHDLGVGAQGLRRVRQRLPALRHGRENHLAVRAQRVRGIDEGAAALADRGKHHLTIRK